MARIHTYAQHFLRSPRLVHELVGHSNLRKKDLVYDLGAGSGVIASVLAERCRQVVAVEVEPGALVKLRQNLATYSNVEIVEQNILELALPIEAYKVFSNIPFNLTSPIISHLTSAANRPEAIYLIVQRQFARKITPSDQHFTSLLGAQIAPWWQSKIRKPLKKTDFTPPPAVDTVLLELLPRSEPLLAIYESDRYREFVEKCFSQQAFFAKVDRARAGVNPELKPSELSPHHWVALYNKQK